MQKGKSNKKRKAYVSASFTRKARLADPEKGPAPTKQSPEKRSAATVEKYTVPVPVAPAPQTPVPPTSLTAGAAFLYSGPFVSSPAVPSPAVDSTAAAAFPSPDSFDVTNDYDDLPVSLKTIWEDSHCELCSENNKHGWKFQWCGNSKKERHHTSSVSHFEKQKGGGIAVFPAFIPPERAAFYAKIYQAVLVNRSRCRRSSVEKKGDDGLRDRG